MISLSNTNLYKDLKLNNHHAYLIYSNDQLLNEAVAITFAKSLVCENNTNKPCHICSACKQFESSSHPDISVIKQKSIKVDDISKIINRLNTKPISAHYKTIVILDVDATNEIAQNKLLKSLEEPNPSSVFIFTTTKTDKLLSTVLSRLNKIYIPQPSMFDKLEIIKEYSKQGINIDFYKNTDSTLTEAVNLATDNAYSSTIDTIFNLLFTLSTTADIPRAVDGMENYDKELFLPCLQDIFLNLLNKKNKYDERLNQLQQLYSPKSIARIVPLIDEAYKKQTANVNFIFILDNLLFNILKEKFLCR